MSITVTELQQMMVKLVNNIFEIFITYRDGNCVDLSDDEASWFFARDYWRLIGLHTLDMEVEYAYQDASNHQSREADTTNLFGLHAPRSVP